MASRSIIQLHFLVTNEYEFFGSPAAIHDAHTSEELMITQKSLNFFSASAVMHLRFIVMQYVESERERYAPRQAIVEEKLF